MKIRCLVDNTVRTGSRFWGEHGAAFLVESRDGRVLFDTGASGTVLGHNLREAGIDPGTVSALALSHAHYDHSGGLATFLTLRPGLPLYANADLLRERYSRRQETGRVEPVGLQIDASELQQKAEVRRSVAPQQLLPGIWTTGEIAERREPEGRSASHMVRKGEGWMPDPYADDMALVLDTGAGLVLLCGCCHAGLLNTLAHVTRVFGRAPAVVAGGTHLTSADAAHLGRLVEALEPMGPPRLYLNHCTGLAATIALARAFGEQVLPFPAGTVLEV